MFSLFIVKLKKIRVLCRFKGSSDFLLHIFYREKLIRYNGHWSVTPLG